RHPQIFTTIKVARALSKYRPPVDDWIQEPRYLFRRSLSAAGYHHYYFISMLDRVVDPAAYCCSNSTISTATNDRGSGALRVAGCVVARSVIHHHCRFNPLARHGFDNSRDTLTLVPGGRDTKHAWPSRQSRARFS